MPKKKAIVIGAGFSGIVASACLAAEGFDVTVLEKNTSPGGRARQYSENGYTFDMGPSWYWMPDVFEHFFNRFNKNPEDYYQLTRLDPSYAVFFGKNDILEIPADYVEFKSMFEQIEQGSSHKLDQFLDQASYKYKVGMQDLVYKPGRSIFEYLSFKLLKDLFKLDLFISFHKHIRKYFDHPRILQLLEFPVLFLGALAKNTPALFSIMNYADIKLGTWYPQGGMHSVIKGMVTLAEELGVHFQYNEPVKGFDIQGSTITGVHTANKTYSCDVVLSGADYQHVETLLPKSKQSYSDSYWQSRTMAPSSLLYYIGINKKINGLYHHNLFFDEDFEPHSKDIYVRKRWPEKPLFYVNMPSRTDNSIAPPDHENMMILIPVSAGKEDTAEIRSKYFDIVFDRLEYHLGEDIRKNIVYRRDYAHNDFIEDYNAFKGNAYGLANTLKQTAILRPSIKSKKIRNLYYAGQLTVPGPGVPPSIISGQVAAGEVVKDLNK